MVRAPAEPVDPGAAGASLPLNEMVYVSKVVGEKPTLKFKSPPPPAPPPAWTFTEAKPLP